MREFRIKGKKNPDLVWKIWREGAEVHVSHGFLLGRLQHSFDKMKPLKVGTRAELSAEAVAIQEVLRRIKDKVDAGYIEVTPNDDTADCPDNSNKIGFEGLQKSLCWMKPRPQPKEGSKEWKDFHSVLNHDYAATIKRDGFMHIILITPERNIKIYTRRMDICTPKYPHIVDAVRRSKIPPRTILLCEFIIVKNGRDSRLDVQAISNSLPDRAVSLQTLDKAVPVVLAIPFWDGEDVFSDRTFGESLDFLESVKLPDGFERIEIDYAGIDHAIAQVKTRRLEGLVIYDLAAKPGEMAYNFRGKPERPRCWKWKPSLEDDFIVVFDPDSGEWHNGGEWGKGRIKNMAGRVGLYQFNSDGDYVYICGCGTGLDETERTRIAEIGGIVGVAEIKFTERRYISKGDKTNALVEPVFVRWSDKEPDEIINPDL